MEGCAAVWACYLGWLLLAIFPRGQVRVSWRILQDVLILCVCSFLLLCWCGELMAPVLLAYLASLLYNDLPSPRVAVKAAAVLITGCDQGIGQAAALHLDKLGFQVFAACLTLGGKGEETLVKAASNRLVTLQMDVRDEQQVQAAARRVAERLRGKALHGVVNNAGILMAGNVEIMTLADIRQIVEVNYMGLIHVYRAFMPLLRQQAGRDSTARLVNIASNIGLGPAALLGIYGSSKAAVALLTETWRYELRPLGISVSTIIPSGFKTGILLYDKEAAAKRWWQAASAEVQDYYGQACFMPSNKQKNHRDYLQADFTSITDCITDALLATQPKPIYYKGLLARTIPYLYLHLPSYLWDLLMPHLADFYHFPVQQAQSKMI